MSRDAGWNGFARIHQWILENRELRLRNAGWCRGEKLLRARGSLAAADLQHVIRLAGAPRLREERQRARKQPVLMEAKLLHMTQHKLGAARVGLHQSSMVGIEAPKNASQTHTHRRSRAQVEQQPAPTGDLPPSEVHVCRGIHLIPLIMLSCCIAAARANLSADKQTVHRRSRFCNRHFGTRRGGWFNTVLSLTDRRVASMKPG
jgi:hypothetical protein